VDRAANVRVLVFPAVAENLKKIAKPSMALRERIFFRRKIILAIDNAKHLLRAHSMDIQDPREFRALPTDTKLCILDYHGERPYINRGEKRDARSWTIWHILHAYCDSLSGYARRDDESEWEYFKGELPWVSGKHRLEEVFREYGDSHRALPPRDRNIYMARFIRRVRTAMIRLTYGRFSGDGTGRIERVFFRHVEFLPTDTCGFGVWHSDEAGFVDVSVFPFYGLQSFRYAIRSISPAIYGNGTWNTRHHALLGLARGVSKVVDKSTGATKQVFPPMFSKELGGPDLGAWSLIPRVLRAMCTVTIRVDLVEKRTVTTIDTNKFLLAFESVPWMHGTGVHVSDEFLDWVGRYQKIFALKRHQQQQQHEQAGDDGSAGRVRWKDLAPSATFVMEGHTFEIRPMRSPLRLSVYNMCGNDVSYHTAIMQLATAHRCIHLLHEDVHLELGDFELREDVVAELLARLPEERIFELVNKVGRVSFRNVVYHQSTYSYSREGRSTTPLVLSERSVAFLRELFRRVSVKTFFVSLEAIALLHVNIEPTVAMRSMLAAMSTVPDGVMLSMKVFGFSALEHKIRLYDPSGRFAAGYDEEARKIVDREAYRAAQASFWSSEVDKYLAPNVKIEIFLDVSKRTLERECLPLAMVEGLDDRIVAIKECVMADCVSCANIFGSDTVTISTGPIVIKQTREPLSWEIIF
jgi:hypothetical protein